MELKSFYINVLYLTAALLIVKILFNIAEVGIFSMIAILGKIFKGGKK